MAVCAAAATTPIDNDDIQQQQQDETSLTYTLILISFAILLVLELPFIYVFLKGTIIQFLEEEYYETAELTRPNCQHDDSSLSTRSDLFKSTSPSLTSKSGNSFFIVATLF